MVGLRDRTAAEIPGPNHCATVAERQAEKLMSTICNNQAVGCCAGQLAIIINMNMSIMERNSPYSQTSAKSALEKSRAFEHNLKF